jgi:hypothetical protein
MGVVIRSALGGAGVGTLVVGAIIVANSLGASSYSLPFTIFATLVVALFLGGAPGATVGAVLGVIRHHRALQPMRPPIPEQSYDMWSELVERCAESTRRVAAVVQTVPKSPARDWLQRISEQLKKELDDVRGIAKLGRALGAVDPLHPVYLRLVQASHDFRKFEDEVGRVALQMFDHPELDEARTHLELLEKQLPQLSA